jgi:hypothetical protein
VTATWNRSLFLGVLVLGPVAVWSLSVWFWRRALHTLRMPGWTLPVELGSREMLIRRNLRTLMAFNFLIVYPAAVLFTAVLLLPGDSVPFQVLAIAFLMILILTVIMLSLVRSFRHAPSPKEGRSISLWVDGAEATALFLRSRGKGWVLHFLMLGAAGGVTVLVALAAQSINCALAGTLLLAIGAVVHECR